MDDTLLSGTIIMTPNSSMIYSEVYGAGEVDVDVTDSFSEGDHDSINNPVSMMYTPSPHTPIREFPSSPQAASQAFLPVLDNLRTVALATVLIGHFTAITLSIGTVQSPPTILPPLGSLSGAWGSVVQSGRYGVEVFFFLSGYLFRTRTFSPPNNASLYVFSFFMRLVRIVPLYALNLLLWVWIRPSEGPFSDIFNIQANQCGNWNWVKNLIFIQNLVPKWGEESSGRARVPEETCMYHGWYLACDVQMTLCFTLLTYLTSKAPKLRTFVSLAVYVLCILLTYIFSVRNGWSSFLFDGMNVREWEVGWYTAPWFRIGTYSLGGGLRGLQEMGFMRTSHRFNWTLRFVGVAMMLTVIYYGRGRAKNTPCNPYQSAISTSPDSCGSEWTSAQMALWNSLGWGSFSLGLALVVTAGGGEEGWFWRFGARISFSVYLVHPLLINLIITSRQERSDMSSMERVYGVDFAGIAVAVVVLSTILCAEVEVRARRATNSVMNSLFNPSSKPGRGGDVDWDLWRRVTGSKTKTQSEIEFKDDCSEEEKLVEHSTYGSLRIKINH
ncbi:hypothetical protein TrCOL_g10941 [Triparma columacea]|uniref:Acyltransferase 3 domain-containing protein n=1 Tax=Triparma columacea TaxID=722753 RepID=A0A9W7LDC9_9STRA|nr:hypothetical protein TrCOL_g10941 [Triparma columacea]